MLKLVLKIMLKFGSKNSLKFNESIDQYLIVRDAIYQTNYSRVIGSNIFYNDNIINN
jgi:hypothetical protein